MTFWNAAHTFKDGRQVRKVSGTLWHPNVQTVAGATRINPDAAAWGGAH